MAIPVVYNPDWQSTHLAIVDAAGNVYVLPHGFQITKQKVERRRHVVEMAFSHGGVDIGDGMHKPRVIEIEGYIFARTEADFRSQLDELLSWLNKDDFYLREKGRILKITRLDSMSHSYSAVNNYGQVSVSLVADDPFWYSEAQKIKEFNITSSPFSFSFMVYGTVETYPVIEVVNNADNTNFTIENTTDNRSIQVQDPQALSGTVIKIDCAEGTVVRDDVNNILHYTSGRFIRLLANRENQIIYTGAAVTLRFKYREAYL